MELLNVELEQEVELQTSTEMKLEGYVVMVGSNLTSTWNNGTVTLHSE